MFILELKANTKIKEIYQKYPWIIDYLPTLAPHFSRLQDHEHRERMFKIATIEIAAGGGGFEVDELVRLIEAEIIKRDNNVDQQRKEILKGIIRDLHAGVDMKILRERFAGLVKEVSASEIAEIEQSLIDEGLPESEVKRLCDVHVEVFKHALDVQDLPSPPAGHPVHTFMVENRAAENILSDIENILREIPDNAKGSDIAKHSKILKSLLDKLGEIEKHYLRKENQLFPKLEAHQVTGPSSVMWALHDDIRNAIKISRSELNEGNPRVITSLKEVIITIRDMIYKEEHILYPMSLETLTDREWLEIKKGEPDIGYSWIEPLVDWAPDIPEEQEKIIGTAVLGTVALDVGSLTPTQVNALLKHLPVDITFVDENNRVVYYSAGRHRIFPRSPGIIGREVKRCHPPTSVHIVEKIVDSFKKKEKDEAEFWLKMGERTIHIRYYPLFDEDGNY
ncbi:MAG: DUF438 domain-containing protein, partial [Candidatus Thorarchaeota archaeon]